MTNSPEPETQSTQNAINNVRKRIAYHNSRAKAEGGTALFVRFLGSFATGLSVYCAVKGGIQTPWLDAGASELAIVAAGSFGVGAHFQNSASGHQERAASLEGALAQHELATGTILFEQSEVAAEAAAPSSPSAAPSEIPHP